MSCDVGREGWGNLRWFMQIFNSLQKADFVKKSKFLYPITGCLTQVVIIRLKSLT